MFNRIAILGLVLFVVAAGPLPAANRFPQTAEDYAVAYELQLYQQLRGNSAEYRRRIKVAEQVIKDFKKSGGKKANEPIAIQWFMMASQSGGALPAVPQFVENAASHAAVPATAPEQAQPENAWGNQPATPAFVAPTQSDSSDADLDFDDVADSAADAWSASEVDEAFGIKSPENGAKESFVTSDPGSTSVLKKGNGSAAEVGSDLADKVWGGLTDASESDALAALGSKAKEALPTFSVDSDSEGDVTAAASNLDAAEAASGDSNLTDAWDTAIEGASANGGLNNPFAGGAGVPSISGNMPVLALLGASMLNGIVSLICWIKTLIVSFKNSALMGIISLLTCGLGGFIIGWIKHKEWGLTKTMKVWSGCMILGFILQMAIGFVGAM